MAFKVVVNRPLMRIILDNRFSGDFGRICVALRGTIEYTLYININIEMGDAQGGEGAFVEGEKEKMFMLKLKYFL